jgi:hypothetical protein
VAKALGPGPRQLPAVAPILAAQERPGCAAVTMVGLRPGLSCLGLASARACEGRGHHHARGGGGGPGGMPGGPGAGRNSGYPVRKKWSWEIVPQRSELAGNRRRAARLDCAHLARPSSGCTAAAHVICTSGVSASTGSGPAAGWAQALWWRRRSCAIPRPPPVRGPCSRPGARGSSTSSTLLRPLGRSRLQSKAVQMAYSRLQLRIARGLLWVPRW